MSRAVRQPKALVAGHAHVAHRGDATGIGSVARLAMAELSDLVQFTDSGRTRGQMDKEEPRPAILNVINGCVVFATEGGLRLSWREISVDGFCHVGMLSDAQSIPKYVDAMRLQAAALRRRHPRAAERSGSGRGGLWRRADG